MRITGGEFRGRPLSIPKAGVRPTTAKSREAIFNMIASRTGISGASVIDLFAGAGSLGLEALSRGADNCIFVERSEKNMRIIRKNAESLGVLDKCTFVTQDALQFVTSALMAADFVVADPPYDYSALDEIVDAVSSWMVEGLFVLEHDGRWDFSQMAALKKTKKYGRTHISLFSYSSESEDKSE